MKYKIKHLFLPALLLTLGGCGGGSDSTTSVAARAGNSAPTFDQSVLSAIRGDVEDVSGVAQWNVHFDESESSFTDPSDSSAFVDFYDINLLAGITDPDGDALSVKNITYLWAGPDCSDTLVAAVRFPEVCDSILAELGLAAGEEITAEQALDVRELQNLPIVDEPIYGFELLQDRLRVTPRNFAPLLVTGETAEFGIRYEVSDGEFTVQRRVLAIVNGVDSAPEFIETNADGTPRLNADGSRIPVAPASLLASDKASDLVTNMIEGLFDQDIFDAQQREREIGDLNNFYDLGPGYQREFISIQDLNVVAGDGSQIPDGFAAFFNNFDPETNRLLGINLILRPSLFADILSAGDVLDIDINFVVFDGTNRVDRTISLTVLGADQVNAPIFNDNLTASINTTDTPVALDLLEGAIDLDSDPMFVEELTSAEGGEEVYGVFLDARNAIVVDPVFFSYLKPGETESFSYTYRISDGSLLSEQRTIDITLVGTTANLAARGTESDPGFESGSLESSGWAWQWSPSGPENLVVTDAEAHSGTYGLSSLEDAMFVHMSPSTIQQGIIEEFDQFYLSFFAKHNTAPWSGVRAVFNKNGNYNENDSIYNHNLSALGVAGQWTERVNTYRATDFFDPTQDETFSITFLVDGNTQMDDFTLVKYNRFVIREMFANGQFRSGTSEGWSVTGDATLEVTLDANRNSRPDGADYGLHITNNTDQMQRLELDPDAFPQGAVKTGMRYIIQFDMRNPSYLSENGPMPLDFGFYEVGGGNFSKRLEFAERSATEWNTYYIHIDTTTDSSNFNGPLNSDVTFDWESTTVQPALWIRAGEEVQIDNLFIYPVPKH